MEPNKLDILEILSDIMKFTLNPVAEKRLIRILELVGNKDKQTSNLGIHMMGKVFHDKQLTGALISSYLSKHAYSKPKNGYVLDTKTLSGNSLIGLRCYKHLARKGHFSSLGEIWDIEELDKTQYRKFKKRCEHTLSKLKKFNNEFS